jgi:hypothetical protein
VSGEVASVPAGFRQRSVFVYSTQGINAAVDVFGATLRAGYNTSKADSEDVFLQVRCEILHSNTSSSAALRP